MSDDFDKEAEREKLREQFERDKKRREATQQMSELLLKGATMTNKHCDTCGDPIFRYEGQEFCANCQSQAGGAGGADAEGGAQAADAANPDAGGAGAADAEAAGGDADASEGDPESRDAGAQAARDATADAASANQATDRGQVSTPAEAGPDAPSGRTASGDRSGSADRSGQRSPPSSGRDAADATGRGAGRDRDRTPDPSREVAGETTSGGDLGEARAALAAAVEKYAQQAAGTDDPRHARDCLAAAREASEALAALRR